MSEPRATRSQAVRWLAVVGLTFLVSVVVLALQRTSRQPPSPPPTGVLPTTPATRPLYVPTALSDVDVLLTALPTRTPPPGPARPARLEIERFGIDVTVMAVSVGEDGYIVTPDRYAGYWSQSAPLSEDGNTVIVGHSKPEPRPIFLDLNRIEVGDEVVITDQFGQEYEYRIEETMVIQVEEAPPEEVQPNPSCPARFVVVATPRDG